MFNILLTWLRSYVGWPAAKEDVRALPPPMPNAPELLMRARSGEDTAMWRRPQRYLLALLVVPQLAEDAERQSLYMTASDGQQADIITSAIEAMTVEMVAAAQSN